MNYVLFYPDEMRAESLACYGHPLVRTPNYDRLARELPSLKPVWDARRQRAQRMAQPAP